MDLLNRNVSSGQQVFLLNTPGENREGEEVELTCWEAGLRWVELVAVSDTRGAAAAGNRGGLKSAEGVTVRERRETTGGERPEGNYRKD